MTQTLVKDSKTQILTAFHELLAQQQKIASKVATKEEEAAKAKNTELLERAATYTVDSIVNSMAALQLDFGSIIQELSQRLESESAKLDTLKRAIFVATANLEQLRKVRLVADALYILRQEHQEKIQALQDNINQQREALENQISQTRKAWEKEQEEWETRIVEEAAKITKQRAEEAADYQYQTTRSRQIAMDEYEKYQRDRERTLQTTNQEKEQGWQEREQYLTANAAEFNANQEKIAGFEEALKKAYTDAKGEAIKQAEREAKVKSDLLEKEWESTQQGFDLKIQSLEVVIERQTAQIAEITAQLQSATHQAQQLAMRAFQSTNSDSN
ncbi:MAG: hypothetical protein SAJ12_06485 [Jaaginema sp. PMC 1079.18]|nr:hypothetical protein [Jaaginema sp. PMC 1080.18]MEC4850640.1 hypothetical protein [Jaaginema sp. PMC 1079.18]MEC4866310.1 hypothetical protein [Jaaginema sp. PMC 1078.18]